MNKIKKFKLVGQILFYIFFAVVLLVVVGMMISKATGKIFFFGDRTMVWVLTNSMEDEIPAQSYIKIRKIEASEIKVNDVITFYSDDPALGGSLNTHRVVEVIDGGREFVTRGDNNAVNDRVNAKGEKVIGVYEGVAPFMTAVGRFFQTKLGLFSIFIFVIAVTAVTFFFDIFKKKPQNKESAEE